MIQVPEIRRFYEACEAGRINSATSTDGRLVCFKYTEATAANADWDDVTLNARGIVFEVATGKIVARPWHKFFNWHELYGDHSLVSKTVEAVKKAGLPFGMEGRPIMLDKIDGSLGIAYWYGGEWHVNTGCNFNSPQALFATKWLRDHVRDGFCDSEHTYLFEIVWHLDRHPIKYGTDELVFLGMVDNATGNEELSIPYLDTVACRFGTHLPEVSRFDSLEKVVSICSSLPSDHEGFVLTWENGFKLKMKGAAYLKLVGFYEKCTDKYLWRAYDPVKNMFHANLDEMHGYAYVDDEPLIVPEELPEIRDRLELYVARYNGILESVVSDSDYVKALFPDMKGRAMYIKEHFPTDRHAPMLSYLRGDNIDKVKMLVNKCVMRPEKGASDTNFGVSD